MDKLTLLRHLHQQVPKLAENIITRWGSSDLDGYIAGMLVDPVPAKLGITSESLTALVALRDIHAAEFPQFSGLTIPAITDQLAGNVHFKVINDRFPHIGNHLIANWGHASFYKFLEDLFVDTRGGKRAGFPEDVGLAIFRLSQQHDDAFPKLVARNSEIWSEYQV